MAYTLSPKENYMRALRHEPTEYTPIQGLDSPILGIANEFERGPGGSGIDGFGVHWVAPLSAAGGALPAPGEFMLKDITEWKKVIKFPDLSKYDWEGMRDTELADINRDTTPIEIWNSNFIFERVATFMGFEETLISMVLEPEATFELMSAILNYKIDIVKHYAKYYKPDVFIYFDDIATERNLFMSPETYRALLKPLHTRFAEAVKECDIIPIQHTCGKVDLIIDDMVETGTAGWHAVQPTNDIEGIIERYGDRFTIIGGYNSNGLPGLEDAPEDVIRAEVRRCMESYGRFGKGFILLPLLVRSGSTSDLNSLIASSGIAYDEALKIRKENEPA